MCREATEMQEFLAKMREYLKMDSEIAYEEFNQYYKKVMEYLQKEFDQLEEDALVAMAGICQILFLNAESRGSRKNEANMKKFRKMAEKSRFWFDALALRLNKQYGLDNEALEKAIEELWGDDEEETTVAE